MEKEKIKILFAEDDENLGMLLREYLIAKGYDTDLYPDGEKALAGFKENSYHVCVFDVMMPLMDGFTLAKEVRILDKDIPIIFLTAKAMKDDIIEGFKIGADDYISKPFSMEELLFRVEAILRRTRENAQDEEQEEFTLGDYVFNSKKQTLIIGDESRKLTTKESELLLLLCLHKNKVLERNYALKTIWVDDNYFNARSMDVYITKLRKYLVADAGVQIINVHGKGFKLVI